MLLFLCSYCSSGVPYIFCSDRVAYRISHTPVSHDITIIIIIISLLMTEKTQKKVDGSSMHIGGNITNTNTVSIFFNLSLCVCVRSYYDYYY
jgi:hypothetical protein